jgi:GNAT superfamily N-acetyltransferase
MITERTVASRVALLVQTWPRLRDAIPVAAKAGADWFRMSTAFDHLDGDEVVAHAGIIPIPMVLDGVLREVAGIHAVCTAASHRGRGHARRVLEAAIAHAERSCDTIVLHAADEAVYGRFGFRAVPQWVWSADVARVPRATPMRRLSIDRPADVARVHAGFRGRVPVADALGIGEAAELFVLDEVLGTGKLARLWCADDLDVVVACDLDERVLQIYDVVGACWPPLAEILARVDGRVDRVELFFAPQRWPAHRWVRRLANTVDVLMVRGPFTSQPIIVPPLARC